METMSFTLGVLSVIITAFVVVLVWGIVKVVKQQKQIEYLQQFIDEQINNLWRSKDEDRRALSDREYQLHQNLDRRFDELERTMKGALKDLDSKLDSRSEDIHRRIDEVYRQMYQSLDEQSKESLNQGKSYTDSRIDKLIDTYFEMVGSKKQIIKG